MSKQEKDIEFKDLFAPLATEKVIFWTIFVGIIIYFNMLFNGFVWDDKTFITLNTEGHSIQPLLLFGFNTFNDATYYRPIPATYFAILYSIFTTNTFFYHLLQLLLHITNAILLYVLFKQFFKNYISLLLSFIFLVHPMQVESVSFIAQTVSPLFFLFGIIALLLLMKIPRTRPILLAGLFLLFSFLTKETGIIFIFLINIYNYLFGKVSKIKLITISVIVILIYLVIRFTIGNTSYSPALKIQLLSIPSIAQAPIVIRLQTIPAIMFYYLKTFVYPVSLGIDQRWLVLKPNVVNFYMPFVIDIASFIALFFLGRYLFQHKKVVFKQFIFFTIWFLLSLMIHIQLIPLNMTVADRWFYVMIGGLLGIIGIVVQEFMNNRPYLKKIMLAILIIFIAALSVRTVVRNTNWQNPIILYTHDNKIDDNADIEYLLGWEFLQSQQYDNAFIHLKTSIAYWPGGDQNWNTLGAYYQQVGKTDNAIQAYSTALEHNNNFYYAYLNLSRAYLFKNDLQEANSFLVKKALVKYPQDPDFWLLKGITDSRLGNKQMAIDEVSKSYNLSNDASTLRILIRMQQDLK